MKANFSRQLISIILLFSMISLFSCGEITIPTQNTTTTQEEQPPVQPDPPKPIINAVGIGESVNLLSGSYIDFASGSISIFDKDLFDQLPKNEVKILAQDTKVSYYENLLNYIDHLTTSTSAKMSTNASAGYDGLAKVTAGFSFDIGADYSKKTQSETKSIFYDMEYMYIDKRIEVAGYNDTSKLSGALSEEFLNDAAKLQDGDMTAEAFIKKYGTHVVTSGIYGAKFNLHYEMITDSATAEETFGTDIKTDISNQIDASLYGVDIGMGSGSGTEVNYSAFKSDTNEQLHTRFSVKALGGSARAIMADSLSQFATLCEFWSEGLNNSDNHVIIDVPDGSLFFVWDYLGEDYIEAKNILNQYFHSTCDDSYYSLKNKVSSIYKDSFIFDDVTGTLIINLTGLQTYETADLTGVNYQMNGETIFDSETGIFTIFSKYNGHDINKIIFEGSYLLEDDLGRSISTHFSPFSIKFDQWWEDDIVIEFRNFAFDAGSGQYAIDYSETNSSDVTIIATGSNYIKGGETNNNGCPAIYAENKNLHFEGEGNIDIFGGNGKDGASSGCNGYDGGTAVYAASIYFDSIGNVNITGGNGGNGVSGVNGSNGSPSYNGHSDRNATGSGANGGNGTNGQSGGNAGKGGYAYIAQYIYANSGTVTATGGNSGNGGNGGHGGHGGRGQEAGGWGTIAGNGGNGGNGGKGGNTYIVSASNGTETVETTDCTFTCNAGQAGRIGIGGSAGSGGVKGMHCDADNCGQIATWGNDGANGRYGANGSEGSIVYVP